MFKNTFFYFLLFLTSLYTFQDISAQSSKKHYIPPITTSDNSGIQTIYISTPSISTINFTITPLGKTPINQTVSNISPYAYEVSSSENGNDSQLHQPQSNTSTISEDKGFIIESSEGLLSVSLRIRSSGPDLAQAGAIVSKGLAALGKEFRIGGLISENNLTASLRQNFVSVMATENDTDITFNIPPGTLIEYNTNTGPFTINLNQNETYILSVGGDSVNRQKLIGSLVSSTKDIVVNSGSATNSFGDNNTRDYGFDQIVSADKVGKE